MLRPFVTSMVLTLAACASGAAQAPLSEGWTVEKDVTTATRTSLVYPGTIRPEGTEVIYVTEVSDGLWIPEKSANLADPATEALWLDPTTRTVGLAATGVHIDPIDKKQDGCLEGDDYNRARGYSACTSRLTGKAGWYDKTMGVLDTLASAPGMTSTAAPAVLSYELKPRWVREALAGADLDDWVRRAATYRAEQEPVAAATAEIAAGLAAQQAMLAEDRLLEEATAYRASLQRGNRTVCGLVLALDPPLAQIQFIGGDTRWVSMREILPPTRVANPASYCGALRGRS